MCFVDALESFTRHRSIPRYFNNDNESDSVCGSLDAEEKVSGVSVVSAVSAALLFAVVAGCLSSSGSARRGARGHLSTADSGHCTDAQRQSRFRPDARKGALIA
jgi:hypothetical protein